MEALQGQSDWENSLLVEQCSDQIKTIMQLKISELGIFQKIKIIIRLLKIKVYLKLN